MITMASLPFRMRLAPIRLFSILAALRRPGTDRGQSGAFFAQFPGMIKSSRFIWVMNSGELETKSLLQTHAIMVQEFLSRRGNPNDAAAPTNLLSHKAKPVRYS